MFKYYQKVRVGAGASQCLLILDISALIQNLNLIFLKTVHIIPMSLFSDPSSSLLVYMHIFPFNMRDKLNRSKMDNLFFTLHVYYITDKPFYFYR